LQSFSGHAALHVSIRIAARSIASPFDQLGLLVAFHPAERETPVMIIVVPALMLSASCAVPTMTVLTSLVRLAVSSFSNRVSIALAILIAPPYP
jgi:hypothetical protein